MAVISRGNITKQLIPGLNQVLGLAYKKLDAQHVPMYNIEKSNRAYEEMVMMTGLGAAPVKGEGAAIQYDDIQETYTARFQNETVALGFAITQEAFEDNLYDTFSKTRANALGRSMAHTKQVKAAAPYNNGFSSFQSGDGVALFSASHPTLSGNQSNTNTLDFSESALESAIIQIKNFKDDRGMFIGATPKTIIAPTDLSFAIPKVLQSTLSTTLATNSTTGITNVNDPNVVKSAISGGYHINQYLTDPDAWFIVTDVPNGMTMFERSPLKAAAEGDFDTGNLRYKATERYSFGVGDWRRNLADRQVTKTYLINSLKGPLIGAFLLFLNFMIYLRYEHQF